MGTFGSGRRRLVLAVLAIAAACVTPGGVASAAPVFDVEGYSTCTATTTPGPDQDFDAVVSTCCAQNAGIPTPTRFGMGCVAPTDGAAADYRPTIVLPMRPAAPEDSQDVQDALGELGQLGDLPPPDPMP
jgi:hypothetical protein